MAIRAIAVDADAIGGKFFSGASIQTKGKNQQQTGARKG